MDTASRGTWLSKEGYEVRAHRDQLTPEQAMC